MRVARGLGGARATPLLLLLLLSAGPAHDANTSRPTRRSTAALLLPLEPLLPESAPAVLVSCPCRARYVPILARYPDATTAAAKRALLFWASGVGLRRFAIPGSLSPPPTDTSKARRNAAAKRCCWYSTGVGSALCHQFFEKD